MRHWNYRLVRRKVATRSIYEVHRVYYTDQDLTKPVYIERSPATVVGVDGLAMIQDIELMALALELPVLYIPEWSEGESQDVVG